MKKDLRFYLRLILLLVFSFLVAFPLVYLFSSSLFSQKDFNQTRLFPTSPVFQNYLKAWGHRYFTTYIINSVGTSILAGIIRTVVVILASFTFTHLEFPGKRVLLASLTLTLFVPQEAILYQNYRTVSAFGLLDTWAAIILPSLF
ncbi:MAG: carbohydrate ABC transporter permease, partial [Spirochaetales bacterium]|nr:carbohydrate ABC transporter permease [Candidatus Physcosoma equi]